MSRIAISRRNLANGLSGVLATALLAGCATHAAPSATVSAAEAMEAMAKGRNDRAIRHAEAAVRADPRNSAYRAMLGDAYLDAGRFVSASSTFSDAFALGDRSPRTALSYALALTGAGLHNEALAVLSAYEGQIPAADLGLAIALAGSPGFAIQMLEEAIRSGENSVKIRQNLAYSYALAHRWREARAMASQDLRADLVNERMEEWSRAANPLAWQRRLARLLDVPTGVRDPGQPVELALANNPSIEQLANKAFAASPEPAIQAERAGSTPAAEPSLKAEPFTSELPPVVAAAPADDWRPVTPVALSIAAEPLQPMLPQMIAVDPVRPPASAPNAIAISAPRLVGVAPLLPQALATIRSTFDAAFAVRQKSGEAPSVASTQALETALSTKGELRPVAAARPVSAAEDSHLVQLGSFSNRESAERAQAIFAADHPELSGHRMVISEAVVGGKRYWRVSAAGFGAGASRAMCSTIRARGEGCFAYAAARPLPGAVNRAIMLARR